MTEVGDNKVSQPTHTEVDPETDLIFNEVKGPVIND